VRITNTLTEEGFKSATGRELGMSAADVPSFMKRGVTRVAKNRASASVRALVRKLGHVRSDARRMLRMGAAGWKAATYHRRRLRGPYFLPVGYRSRDRTVYDHKQQEEQAEWQRAVYTTAARIGESLHSLRVIDVGCGNGEKLVDLYPRFEIIGIDYGENLRRCRQRYEFGTWLEHDLDVDEPLPPSAEVERSIIVCADVIEHLLRPERLLMRLREALEHADAGIISTPERILTHGSRQLGPPPNRAHVREWALDEFAALLSAHRFWHGFVGLTRTHAARRPRNTILAMVFPSAERLAAAGVRPRPPSIRLRRPDQTPTDRRSREASH
jgi:2-polyprenyl-3-methyl-5-hydroxy-6-metoxy-1,4-benzoquinol methylase